MADDIRQSYRLKLGAVVSGLLETLSEQTPAALDTEVQSLLKTRERVAGLEAEREQDRKLLGNLVNQNAQLADALTDTSTSVSTLTEMMDHRTREMITIFVHISTLVGTKFAEGDELENLHRRFRELNTELEQQVAGLTSQLRDQQQARETKVQQTVARAEEERLTLADRSEEPALKDPSDTRRGIEK